MAEEVKQEIKQEVSPGGPRGVGFPSMPLGEAAAAIQELGKYGKVHKLPSLAGHLGHSTTNSGPFRRKVAALRDWGVISGKGDEVSFTQIGLAIALPEGDAEFQRAIRQAFFSSDVFARTFEMLVKGRPLSLEAIGNTAVRNLGVAAGSRDDFIKSFAASAVTAGVADRGEGGSVTLRDDQGDVGEVADDPDRNASPGSDQRKGALAAQGKPATFIRQVWAAGEAQLTFEITGVSALSAGLFGQVGKVAGEIEALAASIKADLEPRHEDTPPDSR